MHQNMPFQGIKFKKFSGEGTVSFPSIFCLWGGGNVERGKPGEGESPTPYLPRRPLCLNPRAFDTWPLHWKMLDLPLSHRSCIQISLILHWVVFCSCAWCYCLRVCEGCNGSRSGGGRDAASAGMCYKWRMAVSQEPTPGDVMAAYSWKGHPLVTLSGTVKGEFNLEKYMA